MDSRVFVFIQSQRELEFHKLHSRSKFDVCFYFATVCTVNVRRLLITSHSRISTSVERENESKCDEKTSSSHVKWRGWER